MNCQLNSLELGDITCSPPFGKRNPIVWVSLMIVWGEVPLKFKLFKLLLNSIQGHHCSHGIEIDPSPVNSIQSWCLALESGSCHINHKYHKNHLTGEVKLISDYYWESDWQQDNAKHLWLREMWPIGDCFFNPREMVSTRINRKILFA